MLKSPTSSMFFLRIRRACDSSRVSDLNNISNCTQICQQSQRPQLEPQTFLVRTTFIFYWMTTNDSNLFFCLPRNCKGNIKSKYMRTPFRRSSEQCFFPLVNDIRTSLCSKVIQVINVPTLISAELGRVSEYQDQRADVLSVSKSQRQMKR